MGPRANGESTTEPDVAAGALWPEGGFVFDVRGHPLDVEVDPLGRRELPFVARCPQASCAGADHGKHCGADRFVDLAFDRSDTTTAVLSALPFAPEHSPWSPEIMAAATDEHTVVGWKVHTRLPGPPWWVDDRDRSVPDVAVLVYHSGCEVGRREGPDSASSPRRVDRLVASGEVAGLGSGSDVHGEPGTTCFRVTREADQHAARVDGVEPVRDACA